ncbi:MAG: hypothetical protein M3173_01190 [Chloroflexota bacterium]|nr:hypothetical protein [Chloroflexota bacterium]
MQPGRRADAARVADQDIIPGMTADQGFKHIYVLADDTSGEGMVITLWESEADLQASQSKVGQRFGLLGDIIVGQPQPSRIYEVVSEG